MTAHFEIFHDAKGEFRFRLKAGNNQVILASEGYKARASAEAGAQSVKKNSDLLARFDRRQSKDGRFYFVLKAANHEIIGTSEMYETQAACDNGISSVMRSAPLAQIKDLTSEDA